MILFSLVLGIFFMNQYPVIRTIGMILGVFQLFLLMILDGENDWGRVPLYRALYCVNVGMSGGILYPYTDTFVTMGANGLVSDREENDFYATEPKATELLLEKETFNKNILEPCAGKGHMRDVLVSHGYNVTATDLIYRGVDDIKQEDVFNINEFDGDIITNPPYKIALPILKHCLDIIPDGNKVAMFLKVLFLEGKERKKFFEENPPKVIYVASGRLNCAKNGDFDKYTSSAVAYAWFVFEKGYKGDTVVKWIN